MKRKENKDLMMQMLRDGVPYKEIAEATGYKVTSLHRYAQDIEERKEHQNTGVKSYKDLIIRWFEQGKTAEEIEEVAFPEKQLSFVERRKVKTYPATYGNKRWMDITDGYLDNYVPG